MCSRVAGGDEPPSVLSDNLHNLILRMKAPAFQAGLFAVPVLPTDTPILQVAHELDVRLGWSPVVSSSLSRRWSRCHRTVTRCPHLGLRHRDWTGVSGTNEEHTGAGGLLPPRTPTRGGPADPHLPGFPPLCSSPPAPRPTTSARPGQAGVQRNVRAVDLDVPPGRMARAGGAGHGPARQRAEGDGSGTRLGQWRG
jgi:hypothetical protein